MLSSAAGSHEYLRIKILLHKRCLFCNLFCGEECLLRRNHELFFHVVVTVNNSYHLADKFLYRFVDTENISVLFFTVRGDDPLNVAVVYRINNVLMLRMTAAERPVNRNFLSLNCSSADKI